MMHVNTQLYIGKLQTNIYIYIESEFLGVALL